MRLYEFEGKALFSREDISIPRSFLVTADSTAIDDLGSRVVLKAQTLSGNRAAKGGIVKMETDSVSTLLEKAKQMMATGLDGEHVERVLIEEMVADIAAEHYVALKWDTATRGPVMLYTAKGGSGIEGRQEHYSTRIATEAIDVLQPEVSLQAIVTKHKLSAAWFEFLTKLWKVFYTNDANLVEVNPVFELTDGKIIAGDAKVELNDLADYRHPEWAEYPKRTLFMRVPTPMEEEAKKINEMDHRGVAGASFFEFDGEIGIMASGGGASLLAMDALMASGLKPANYTEYSGNPTREKVAALTKLVLSKKGLRGLWVVGGNANFTDIYETLAGVMDGLEATTPKVEYPIVIRRGGPRWQEAFEMIKDRAAKGKFDISLFGPDVPMLETVNVLVEKVQGKK